MVILVIVIGLVLTVVTAISVIMPLIQSIMVLSKLTERAGDIVKAGNGLEDTYGSPQMAIDAQSSTSPTNES